MSSSGPEPSTADPLVAAAPIFGRKWHVVVLHRLLERGPLGFSELARSVEGLSHKTLSNCLADLRERGLVTKTVVSEEPYRVEYALTERGSTLEPVIEAMAAWGRRAVTRVETPDEAIVRVPR